MSDQQKEIGTLVVIVLKAQHLHQPSFYKQSPYAQTTLSGLTKRTKADPKGGQHPAWDEEFRFPVLADAGKDKANRILEVACYKDEQRGDDVLLGKGTVDIEETLKTGEFDDWVSLETSAGARGEIYLEMTFYANSPPPITRRPSKLNPSDRVTRPTAYFNQGRQSTPNLTSPNTSPRPARSPVGGERKLVQQSQTGGTHGAQLPVSLIPVHGPQSQPSRQASPNGGTFSVATVKQRDDPLPPLPVDDASSDAQIGFGKKPGLPASLQPGGGGPRPMPPPSRNRVLSTNHPPPEMLPQAGQPPRRSLSDTPTVNTAVPSPSLPLQSPMQYYTPGTTPVTSATPSIVVDEPIEDHPRVAFPIPFSPPLRPSQEHESRGVYVAGNYDSFAYGFPGQVYTPPNSHAYTSATTPAYPQVTSSSQHPPGQPQQHYDSPYQPYTQYPNASSAPFSAPPISHQLHSVTPQLQQQQQYPLQQPPCPPQLQQYAPHQQTYSPPPHQQYLSSSHQHQHHPPQVPQTYQQYNHSGVPSSGPAPIPRQQIPLYTQTFQQPQQQHFAIPAPLQAVQSQTLQSYAQQPQQHFSIPPPPPPPPPPPLPQYSQAGKGHPPPNPVEQPPPTPPSMSSRAPISPTTPLPQNADPVVPLSQPPTTTTLSSQIVLDTPRVAGTEEVVRQRQEERNEVQPILVLGSMQGDVTTSQVTTKESEQIAGERRWQVEEVKNTEEQGGREESDCEQQMEEQARQQREEGLRRQDEERLKEQEAERRGLEEAERRKREEEEKRREEEQRRRLQEEELKRSEERIRRAEEECRRQEEEEELRREEEEHRREEERRKLEEERRRQEERKREEERRRREEERKRQEEEEFQRKEEERIRQEHEEAERRHQVAEEEARRRRAEEAEAERRWQEELARIRARAEQEAADAAFARAQMEAEEQERRRQEEADLALVHQAQEEAEREERLARERRRQEEADMEVAKREQAHEEELERRRQEDRRRRIEEADRELARKLDMELNLSAESPSNSDQSRQRSRAERNRRH